MEHPLSKIPGDILKDFPWQDSQAINRYIMIEGKEYRISGYYPQEDVYTVQLQTWPEI